MERLYRMRVPRDAVQVRHTKGNRDEVLVPESTLLLWVQQVAAEHRQTAKAVRALTGAVRQLVSTANDAGVSGAPGVGPTDQDPVESTLEGLEAVVRAVRQTVAALEDGLPERFNSIEAASGRADFFDKLKEGRDE